MTLCNLRVSVCILSSFANCLLLFFISKLFPAFPFWPLSCLHLHPRAQILSIHTMHKFGGTQKCWKKVLTGIRGSLRPQDYWSSAALCIGYSLAHWDKKLAQECLGHSHVVTHKVPQPVLLQGSQTFMCRRVLKKRKWNGLNFPPGVSLTHVVFHCMLHRQIKVSSVRTGLSQKPGLAEPGCELGQMLCTGHTYLARLGPGAYDRSIRGLLLLLFVPSLQSLFGGWWKNIEYGWFFLEGSIATHRRKYCYQKDAVSLGERWASCRGQEAGSWYWGWITYKTGSHI